MQIKKGEKRTHVGEERRKKQREKVEKIDSPVLLSTN